MPNEGQESKRGLRHSGGVGGEEPADGSGRGPKTVTWRARQIASSRYFKGLSVYTECVHLKK